MSQTYDYHFRHPSQSWLLMHITVLLEEATKYKNSSLVLYAAFEARSLLEKIEFDILLMSVEESEHENLRSMASGKNGINKTNNQYKTLRYRYQTFSEALTKVILDQPLRVFDYSKSGRFQVALSDYIHIYTRPDDEFKFTSAFIQTGIQLCKEVVAYIKSYFVKVNDEYLFGILNFKSLNDPMKIEFEAWKKDVTEDTESLYLRLKKINDELSGGVKATHTIPKIN